MLSTIEGSNYADEADILVEFAPKLDFRHGKYECALINARIPYSCHNISSTYNNLTLKYSDDSWVSETVITLPAGNYSYTNLISAIKYYLEENGDTAVVDGSTVYPFTLSVNNATGYAFFSFDTTNFSGYEVNCDSTLLTGMLGYASGQLPMSATTVASATPVNIFSHGSIHIHCDLVKSYLGNKSTDILYTSNFDAVPFAPIHITPNVPLYLPLECRTQLDRYRLRLKFEDGTKYDLNGEHVHYMIHIRERH
jgi:hypothetical protein